MTIFEVQTYLFTYSIYNNFSSISNGLVRYLHLSQIGIKLNFLEDFQSCPDKIGNVISTSDIRRDWQDEKSLLPTFAAVLLTSEFRHFPSTAHPFHMICTGYLQTPRADSRVWPAVWQRLRSANTNTSSAPRPRPVVSSWCRQLMNTMIITSLTPLPIMVYN